MSLKWAHNSQSIEQAHIAWKSSRSSKVDTILQSACNKLGKSLKQARRLSINFKEQEQNTVLRASLFSKPLPLIFRGEGGGGEGRNPEIDSVTYFFRNRDHPEIRESVKCPIISDHVITLNIFKIQQLCRNNSPDFPDGASEKCEIGSQADRENHSFFPILKHIFFEIGSPITPLPPNFQFFFQCLNFSPVGGWNTKW